MDIETTLSGLGLCDGEVKVYLALLKRGEAQVNQIKLDTGIHRTTVYQYLEQLMTKGLVGYVLKSKIRFFHANPATKLLDLLKEKEDNVRNILPQLLSMKGSSGASVNIEVYQGPEGLKTILNEVLKLGKDYVGLGIDEAMFEAKFRTFMPNFFRREEEAGIHERMISRKSATFFYHGKNIKYRLMPDEFFNPTSTFIYGDKIGILIWEPLTTIIIEHPQLADSYRKHFEVLWKLAKPYHLPKAKAKK